MPVFKTGAINRPATSPATSLLVYDSLTNPLPPAPLTQPIRFRFFLLGFRRSLPRHGSVETRSAPGCTASAAPAARAPPRAESIATRLRDLHAARRSCPAPSIFAHCPGHTTARRALSLPHSRPAPTVARIPV